MKPMNINQAFKNVPGKGRIKSGDYRRFKTDLEKRLQNYEQERKDFVDCFNDGKFTLQTTLKIYVPSDLYTTKKGDISIKKGDCGNYRKCVQDVIFDWLGVDDKYSVDEHNHQIEDDQGIWGFSFEIQLDKR